MPDAAGETPMTVAEAREALIAANHAIGTAAFLVGHHRPLLERFMRESATADSILPIEPALANAGDPTLWMNPERQRTDALLAPLYEAVLRFLDAYREATEQAGVEPAGADRE